MGYTRSHASLFNDHALKAIRRGLPPYIHDSLSKETLEMTYRFHSYRKDKDGNPKGHGAFIFLHVADGIQRGTITPAEGYEIEDFYHSFGYIPEWARARKSIYMEDV